MATNALATAFVNVVPSLKGFDAQLKGQLGGTMDAAGVESGNRFNKGFGGTLSKIGGVITAALATGAVVNFTKSLIDAGEQEVAGNARLTQIAKSMGIFGAQADTVSQRLQDLSGVQQLALGIDDDVIKSTQAKLLTFKELAKTADSAGGAFDRATMAAVDLAAAGFGSAESNAVQLGKALQDPIKGITALARAGVTFTDEEKKRIKTLVESNKIGEAQNLVLQAIETQVGGTAAATATSSGKMTQAFSQLKENLGLLLLPAFQQFAGYVTTTVIPAFQQFVDDFKAGKTPINDILNGVKGLLDYVKNNWQWISTLGVAVLGAATAFKGLKLAVEAAQAVQVAYAAITAGIAGIVNLWKIATGQATLAQLGLNAAMLANPIGLIVAAVAALVAGLVYFFTQTDMGKKIWGNFTKFLSQAWDNTIKFFTDTWNAVTGAFTAFGQWISKNWKNILSWILFPALNVIQLIIDNWGGITKFFATLWTNVLKFFNDAWVNITNGVRVVIANVIKFFAALPGNVISFMATLPSKVIAIFAGAGKWLFEAGRNVVQGLINGAAQLLPQIGRFFLDLLPSFIREPFKQALGIRSPSRVFKEFGKNILQGLNNGLKANVDSVRTQMAKVSDWVIKAFDDKKITKKTKTAALALVGTYRKALVAAASKLEKVNQQLADAQDVLTDKLKEQSDYIDNIASKFGSSLQITAPTDSLTLLQKEQDLIDLRKELADATEQYGANSREATIATLKLADAQKEFNDLQDAGTAAGVARQLRDRIKQNELLAGVLGKLQDMGISGDLYKQILESGSVELAQSIIDGGSAAVKELNDLAAKANSTALKLGKDAGDILFGKGIEVAQGVVDGLKAKQQELRDFFNDLADEFASRIADVIKGASGGKKKKAEVASTPDFTSAWTAAANAAGFQVGATGRLIALASGGYVDRATPALIGEAGPEVVTPLKDFERMMGLNSDNAKSPTIIYNAAPNQSLDAEQALFQAMRRAKVVGAW